MTLKQLGIAALIALVLATGWRFRHHEALQEFLNPESQHQPPPFKFDNGTARTYAPPSSEPMATLPTRPGAMRKCVKGSVVSYTDQLCPPGFKEQPLSGGAVTVVTGQGQGATAAKAQSNAEKAAARTRTVRDVLDVDAQTMKDQAMERAIGR